MLARCFAGSSPGKATEKKKNCNGGPQTKAETNREAYSDWNWSLRFFHCGPETLFAVFIQLLEIDFNKTTRKKKTKNTQTHKHTHTAVWQPPKDWNDFLRKRFWDGYIPVISSNTMHRFGHCPVVFSSCIFKLYFQAVVYTFWFILLTSQTGSVGLAEWNSLKKNNEYPGPNPSMLCTRWKGKGRGRAITV